MAVFPRVPEALVDLAAEAADSADSAEAVSAAEVPEEVGKKLLHDINQKKVPTWVPFFV